MGLKKEVVFDESGQTVEEVEVAQEGDVDQTEEVEATENPAEETEEQETPEPGKYKVGDRTFDTQGEALAYASSILQTGNQVTDAYRQGVRDALSRQGISPENVTPSTEVPPAYNAEQLFADPQGFLTNFAKQIKVETRQELGQELDQKDRLKSQSDSIWREFTDRHPSLAEFRSEVEDFVEKNQKDVRGIVDTQGRAASYDFIALKLKSRFQSYSNALKPKRELPNTKSDASPSSKSSGVTPKTPAKKTLSFADQLRSIRKRGT